MTEARKFSFDTVFDGGGEVVSAPVRMKRAYTADEADVLRQEACREGEAAALASLQGLQAQALADLAETARAGLAALAQVAHNHRVHAAGLAMAAGKAIADAALERFPQAPLEAALESLSREFTEQPRLILRTPLEPALMSEIAEQIAADIGYAGQIVVKPEAGETGAAFSLDWGDGSAVFNPESTAARIADVIASALAAERLHADPIDLSPDGEA
ncbi:MAG: flagellar assembly protein FliH [Caulobacteraceae bacterium]|nr:flagellar assembly protein FliH [Caulobacteraceae bacterium]